MKVASATLGLAHVAVVALITSRPGAQRRMSAQRASMMSAAELHMERNIQ